MSPDARALIAALPWPTVVIDGRERIEAANAAATQLFGHDASGRHYVVALRQPATIEAVDGTLRDGAAREGRYQAGGAGRAATWRVSTRAVALGAGRRVVVTFEDVSAVEEAGHVRRDFVANLSHELRTPLTALLGFVETLEGPAREDQAARDRFLPVIAREARRMARLVDDLLQLSRVEAEERRRPSDPVDLRALIRSTAATFEDMAARAGATIRLRLPEGEAVARGDARQLGQVVTNLVENALKYGGGAVEVALEGPDPDPVLGGRAWSLSVSDDGPGIEAHHLPRLTERFYRADDHRSREVGGTGLGLAIVKHVLSRHRGRLRIESRLGQGSRFTALLPAG